MALTSPLRAEAAIKEKRPSTLQRHLSANALMLGRNLVSLRDRSAQNSTILLTVRCISGSAH